MVQTAAGKYSPVNIRAGGPKLFHGKDFNRMGLPGGYTGIRVILAVIIPMVFHMVSPVLFYVIVTRNSQDVKRPGAIYPAPILLRELQPVSIVKYPEGYPIDR